MLPPGPGPGQATGFPLSTPRLAAAAALPTAPVAVAIVDSGAGKAILVALHCVRAELGARLESGSGGYVGSHGGDEEATRDPEPTERGGGGMAAAALAVQPPPVVRHNVACYSGSLPLKEEVGWVGKPAALVGLDLLCPAKGAVRRLVLDMEASAMWVD